jgi:hypothetical protein
MLNSISPENKASILNALKKGGYRIGIYALVVGSALSLDNLHLLNLSPYLTTVIGFALGELHSWAQTRYDLNERVATAMGLPRQKGR